MFLVNSENKWHIAGQYVHLASFCGQNIVGMALHVKILLWRHKHFFKEFLQILLFLDCYKLQVFLLSYYCLNVLLFFYCDCMNCKNHVLLTQLTFYVCTYFVFIHMHSDLKSLFSLFVFLSSLLTYIYRHILCCFCVRFYNMSPQCVTIESWFSSSCHKITSCLYIQHPVKIVNIKCLYSQLVQL